MRIMDLRQLEYFLWVAQRQEDGAAANRCSSRARSDDTRSGFPWMSIGDAAS
jgi:hypothetical protein